MAYQRSTGKKAYGSKGFCIWKCLTNACSLSKNSFEHVLNMFWTCFDYLVGGWDTPLKKDGVRQLGWLFLIPFPTDWKVIKIHGSSHHRAKLSTQILRWLILKIDLNHLKSVVPQGPRSLILTWRRFSIFWALDPKMGRVTPMKTLGWNGASFETNSPWNTLNLSRPRDQDDQKAVFF